MRDRRGRRTVIGAALVALAAAGCSVPLRGARPSLIPPGTCPDGAPVKWLQHPACGRVCGFSCLPDRWRDPVLIPPAGALSPSTPSPADRST